MQNNEVKNNKKGIIIIICIVLLIVGLLLFKISIKKNNTSTSSYSDITAIRQEKYDNINYYILTGEYKGKYNVQEVLFNLKKLPSSFNKNTVMNYLEYSTMCLKYKINQEYNDKDMNYIVVRYGLTHAANADAKVGGLEYENGKATLYVWDEVTGVVADSVGYILVVPVPKDINEVDVISLINEEEFYDIKNNIQEIPIFLDKPIIYLYPTKETNITVKLEYDKNITHSYPKYNSEWKVKAKPNGDLIDLKTNRNLYALYYESLNEIEFNTDDGFIVKGEDTIKFLEEKLEILGLNQKEAEEFIIYWLPKLENNKYNYIRFATLDEINKNMPLIVEPTPDTLIRVLMIYKPLDKEINVKEQQLTKIVRSGYTLVEWGGTNLQ